MIRWTQIPQNLEIFLCLLLLLTVRSNTIFTVRNSNCGKEMFSQVFVKNSVHGGCIPACTWADTHPWANTPPGQTPLGQTPGPPWAGTPPCPVPARIHPTRLPLQRTIRILLECILVLKNFWEGHVLFVRTIPLFWTSGDVI